MTVKKRKPPKVAASSKPQHVDALRSIWRKSREHYWEQVKRFLRIFAGVMVPQVFALGSDHLTRSALLALVPGALEVVFRQLFPALGAKAADSAPGVTIVPEEVTGDAPPDEGGYTIIELLVGAIVLLVFVVLAVKLINQL